MKENGAKEEFSSRFRKSMTENKLDIDPHSFSLSFRWYQHQITHLTGTLGTPDHLDSDHETHEKWKSVKSIRYTLNDVRALL